MSTTPASDADLKMAAFIGGFAYNPHGFVRSVYPWGKAGTWLEKETGPDKWQGEILTELAKMLRAGASVQDATGTAIKIAVASGHGIGKTALVAWIIHWFTSCFEFGQTVVTANTKTQLLTKTWRELAKWHRLSIHAHWHEWTATQFKHTRFPDSWFASAIPWSEHASEAFAGTHEKFVLVIMDEASLIADKIAEVTEGAMTTANAIWLAFGNPTRNSGWFSECFGRMKHRWRTWQIDSRTAKMANKAQIQQWIDDYGEDSDFVRVRVRGVFPRAGSMQFISGEDVLNAMKREAAGFEEAARIMGIDVARHGDDQSVVSKRQGLKLLPQLKWRIADLMLLADKCMEEIIDYDPDGVFVDVTGIGWGLHDALRRRLGERAGILYAVQVGEKAIDEKRFYNRRAEIWWRMREWIQNGACLPNDPELEGDLTGIEYGYDNKERVQMEKKEDMKERGLSSPDCGDSIAVTFTNTILPRARPKKATWRDKLEAMRRSQNQATTPQSA